MFGRVQRFLYLQSITPRQGRRALKTSAGQHDKMNSRKLHDPIDVEGTVSLKNFVFNSSIFPHPTTRISHP